MAKREEAGIEYFPINADIVHNPKVELVVTEFGPKAWAVLLLLYAKIYREKGYWIDWNNNDLILPFAKKECDLDVPFVKEVVSGFIRRSLFNKEVFDKFGILTSDRIQHNYFRAKARNTEAIIIKEFIVKDEKNEHVYKKYKNVRIIDLSVDIITKKVNILRQKEKEIIKLEGDGDCATAHTPEQILLFKKFQDWVGKNAPRVNQLKESLNIDQFLKLREDLNQTVIMEVLTAMQNKADLLKKYVSANLTIRNWSKNQHSITPKEPAKSNLSAAIKAIESGN